MKHQIWIYLERAALVILGAALCMAIILGQRVFAKGELTITLTTEEDTGVVDACYTTGAVLYRVGSGVIEHERNCDIFFRDGLE